MKQEEMKGKPRIKTIFNIFKHIKYYKYLFIHFYLTNLTWEIAVFLSNKFRLICSKVFQQRDMAG